jgi:hypothetical protein
MVASGFRKSVCSIAAILENRHTLYQAGLGMLLFLLFTFLLELIWSALFYIMHHYSVQVLLKIFVFKRNGVRCGSADKEFNGTVASV